jgi:hypothetical protein
LAVLGGMGSWSLLGMSAIGTSYTFFTRPQMRPATATA